MSQTNPETSQIIYRTRTYKQRISKHHPLYQTFKELSIKSKNLYNLALYTERQQYFESQKSQTPSIIPKFTLTSYLSTTEAYKQLPAKCSQQIILQVYQTFNSFFKATKEYNKHPERFLGRPKIPKYKDKQKGRNIVYFDYQQLKIFNNRLKLPKNLGTIKLPNYISNIQVKSSKETYDLNTQSPELELIQLRIIPRHHEFELEYAYTKRITLPSNQSTIGTYAASIDLGLDNFAAIAFYKPNTPSILINGKGLKSYNQWFNKTLATLKSQASKHNLKTTAKIQRLYLKRQRYFNTWMHQASKFIVDQLLQNNITILVIGRNHSQKQRINLGHKTNQSFVQIPYDQFYSKLRYKCEQANIRYIETEESYTSGTSFLDNEQPTKENYNPKRRIHRGLFRTNTNQLINSDINAAYQILKKQFPTVYYQPQLSLQALKVNIGSYRNVA